MGKPRKKGMRRGYLKRFSSQVINGGRYSPKTVSKAEEARPKRSIGFGSPDLGILPPALTPPKKWEIFVNHERLRIDA